MTKSLLILITFFLLSLCLVNSLSLKRDLGHHIRRRHADPHADPMRRGTQHNTRPFDRLLNKVMTCVRNRLGSSENREARCTIREMLRVFQVRDGVKCKNCDEYFYCVANAKARTVCGDDYHVRNASLAVSECEEIRDIPDEEDNDLIAESLTLSSNVGRNGGNCASEYLCSVGCRFATTNETCSLTCR